MKNNLLKRIYCFLLTIPVLCLLSLSNYNQVKAESASAVKIGTIDYEDLSIQIFNNGNTAIYYSVDSDEWTELEGAYSSSTKSYSMDISWISDKADVTLYFKGNTVADVAEVTIPKQDTDFKATFNIAEGDFDFEINDDAEAFEWRKASDYNWNRVSLDYSSASYRSFLDTIERFQMKGAKIIIRLPQTAGKPGDAGKRPGKEITISIPARAEAPSIKVNSSKLTVNTSSSMEYYDAALSSWMDCSNTMPLSEIAPGVLYENGSKDTTLMIRKRATSSAAYSETAYVVIKGQPAAPEIGDMSKDVTYYYVNSKLALAFNKATEKNAYEYAIVKAYDDFDPGTARWVSVKNNKLLYLSARTAPEGCTIYVRKRGQDASSSADLVLSSAVNSFTVSY